MDNRCGVFLLMLLAWSGTANAQASVQLGARFSHGEIQKPIPLTAVTLRTYALQGQTGWAYEISVSGTPYIRQENIPAVEGIQRFRTEADAAKTGARVADKLRQGLPFSLTPQEVAALHLQSLTQNGVK